ncbi:hypothetical protein ACWTU6_14585 [Mesorhizobium sp. BHbsci]
MSEHLFQGPSWHQEFEARVRKAIDTVARMPRDEVSNPASAGILDELARSFRFDVPTLLVDQKSGNRREERRVTEDGWGERVNHSFPIMDITIPFSGDPDGFRLHPSHSPHGLRATIRSGSIVLSLPDDDRVQSAVDSFEGRVSQTLDLLRREVATSEPLLATAIENAFQQRHKEVEEQSRRDGNLSFRSGKSPTYTTFMSSTT